MVIGPLFVLVPNKPSFHWLSHMLLAYMEANEGHKLLPCCCFFFFPLTNSAPIMMQSRQYSSNTGSKQTYYLIGMTCRDGLYSGIFAAMCLARIPGGKKQNLATGSDKTNIMFRGRSSQVLCWCSKQMDYGANTLGLLWYHPHVHTLLQGSDLKLKK